VARLARLLTHRDRVIESVSTGNSMGSTLPSGTRLRFRCGRGDAKPGDVVVVLAGPADLIVHRVVARGWGPRARGYLVTRGDSSVLCDQPVTADAVLGVVEECRRDDAWGPVGPSPSLGVATTMAAAVLGAVMLGVLAISPRLAIFVAAGSYGLVSRVRALGASLTG
jgi:hypothetical protein